MGFSEQVDLSLRLLDASPTWRQVCELAEGLDEDLARQVVLAAADISENLLLPLNGPADASGCRIENGRVKVPEAYHAAWAGFTGDGWLGIDAPEDVGGQGLPLALQAACQMLFDRSAIGFGMLGGATRSAVFVLDAHAEEPHRSLWSEKLLTGEWSATICISEPDAGSDLGRVRTKAVQGADGTWRITGNKCWISYGDHDMTPRIGHMLLARTGDAASGTRGLSLFLVPNTTDDGAPNGVTAERLEEKLGLHGSPTCVMRFEEAEAILIGKPNNGLPQLFAMIERMRILTGCQGAGLALASLDLALGYAAERKQGGAPTEPPVPINQHADVRRQLAEMASRCYSLQAFLLELGGVLDLAAKHPHADVRAENADLAAFLLPIAKNFGGFAGFDIANRAIQIFGGAGYTREWPVEQHLRDARILTVYEGTTGMQALDLLYRRLWKDEGKGLKILAQRMRADIAATQTAHGDYAAQTEDVLSRFLELADALTQQQGERVKAEYGADAFLNAAWSAVSAWMGLRLITVADDNAQLATAGRLRIREADIAISESIARTQIPADCFEAFREEA